MGFKGVELKVSHLSAIALLITMLAASQFLSPQSLQAQTPVPGDMLFSVKDNRNGNSTLGDDVLVYPNQGKMVIGASSANGGNGKIEIIFTPNNYLQGYEITDTGISAGVATAPGLAKAGFSLARFESDTGSNPRLIAGCPQNDGEVRIGTFAEFNINPSSSTFFSGSPEIPAPLGTQAGDWVPKTIAQQGANFGHDIVAFRQGTDEWLAISGILAKTRASATCSPFGGCPLASEGGAVRFYKNINGTFTYQFQLLNPTSTCSGGFCVTTDARFGQAMRAGDVNNDGLIDLIISAPGALNARGRVYVYYSVANLTGNVSPSLTITPPSGWDSNNNEFGYSIDFNDTVDLLVVGAPFADPPSQAVDSGAVFTFRFSLGNFILHGYPLIRPFLGGHGGTTVALRVASPANTPLAALEIDAIMSAPAVGRGIVAQRRVWPEVTATSGGDPAPLTYVSFPSMNFLKQYEAVIGLPDMDGDTIADFYIAQQVSTGNPANNNIARVTKGLGPINPSFIGSSTQFAAECIPTNSPAYNSIPATGGSVSGPYLTTHSSSAGGTGLPKVNQLFSVQTMVAWTCYAGQPCTNHFDPSTAPVVVEIDFGNYSSGQTVNGCTKYNDGTYSNWYGYLDPSLTQIRSNFPGPGDTTYEHYAVVPIAYIPQGYSNTQWIGLARYWKTISSGSSSAVQMIALSSHLRVVVGQ